MKTDSLIRVQKYFLLFWWS